ncbi:MAG TPA: serine protease [Micromonosporaceae bacterium]|nr:serine protease [Micromonosporaceae bacterium]HCU52232.1 serine protease [Micromonosporaceae bacterium]
MGRRALVFLAIMALTLAAPANASATPSAESTASKLRIPGTAWHTDENTGQIVVSADSTVTGARLDALRAAVAPAGRTIRIQHEPGELRILIAGGQAIYTGGARCSLGANVRRGNTYFFVTAGHCTNIGATWYSNASQTTLLGSRTGTSFPGNDYGIVRYTNPAVSHPSAVHTYPGQLTIRGAGNAQVGQAVCRSGSTTGVRCGVVTGLNATVNYPQGVVAGLIRTNICAEPGDSGGPLYIKATGIIIGILSGGSGNCTTGGTTFYQPIGEILTAYGVTIP